MTIVDKINEKTGKFASNIAEAVADLLGKERTSTNIQDVIGDGNNIQEAIDNLSGSQSANIMEAIDNYNGDDPKSMTIEEALENTEPAEVNPLESLSIDSTIGASVDLFGKVVADLQDGVEVGDDSITGTLKYVTDYTGFSGDPALQSGNYLVIHCEVPDLEGATITVTVTNPSVLDEDGIIVLRIADHTTQTVTVVASADGYDSVTKTFSLSELVCLDTDFESMTKAELQAYAEEHNIDGVNQNTQTKEEMIAAIVAAIS